MRSQSPGHPVFAALYDLIQRPAEKKFLRGHRDYLAGGASGRVLDVGSGTGRNFEYYRLEAEIVGIEPDPYMLRRAQARADRLGRRVKLLLTPSASCGGCFAPAASCASWSTFGPQHRAGVAFRTS